MEEDIFLDDIDNTADFGASILPAQWAAAAPAAWTAEQKLYAALLNDALLALQWCAGHRETSRRWLETISWIEGAQATVTFAACCRALDYDPHAARRAIYQRIAEYRALNLARQPLPRRRRPAAAKSPARRAITRQVESAQRRLLPDLPPAPACPPRPRRPAPAVAQAWRQLSFRWFREPAARLAA